MASANSLPPLERDNLDENASGDQGVKRRPLAGVVICLGLPVRKHFLHGTISLDGRLSELALEELLYRGMRWGSGRASNSSMSK
jgi:hypothetical protein